MRLVLDTNVILDLLLFGDPRVAPIAAAIADGRATCFADAEILIEIERVLSYPELRQTPASAAAILERFKALATVVETPPGSPGLPRCRDPDDQKFLALAVAVGADFLLSRDRELLRMARRIGAISPALLIALPETLSNRLRSAD